MTALTAKPAPPGSWWHEGERALQQTIPGGREQAEGPYAQFLRTVVNRQHEDFFTTQQLIYMGRQREDGSLEATVMVGKPGFASFPDPQTLLLRLDLMDAATRPASLSPGQRVGLLGIQFHDRRRNRLNGHVETVDDSRVLIRVDQSYGNCPKYIQRREVVVAPQLGSALRAEVHASSGSGPLPPPLARLVRSADTFFVASSYKGSHTRAVGADMSHRGGSPGFVRVSVGGGALMWGDYTGNGMFQTLGNLLTNPACTLLFVDYQSGDALQVDGEAEVSLDPAAAGEVPGAERLVRVRVVGWRHVAAAVPVVSHTFLEASPYNPAENGDAAQVEVQQLKVLSVRNEAEGVKTFEIAAPIGGARGLHAGMYAAFGFTAGTFKAQKGGASADLTRTWTVSSYHPEGVLPEGGSFTISVKRDGLVSSWLHDSVAPGRTLGFLGFGGDFTLERMGPQRGGSGPVVLLGGGIGVTPLRPLLAELRASQPARDVVVLLSVQAHSQAAFGDELLAAAAASGGRVTVVVTSTRDGKAAPLSSVGSLSREGLLADGGGARAHGRIGRVELAALVPRLADASVFMCGPGAFMGAMEAALEAAGVDPLRVHHESFDY